MRLKKSKRVKIPMNKPPPPQTQDTIPHEIALARIEQGEQMRDFMIEVWLQNPQLARQAGPRVLSILQPSNHPSLKVKAQT